MPEPSIPDAVNGSLVPSRQRPVHLAEGGHVPVLLAETIAGLGPITGGTMVDATFGGGGHTRMLLDRVGPHGRVLAIDADPAAIARGERLREELRSSSSDPDRLTMLHGNFRDLGRLVREVGVTAIDGIMFDLGLSSFQLDTPQRGFAFRFDGPLDMRFDPTTGTSAADLVNELPAEALADVIYQYGEEHRSRRIAATIVARREERPFDSTADLAAVVARAAGGRRGKGETHPATRTFQALRIAVNGELDAIPLALDAAVGLLRPGRRLAVISFHSLEDRIVKRFIADASTSCVCPPHQPVCTCGTVPRLKKVGGSIRAGAAETASNPRSRSATLRVAERLADGEASTPGGPDRTGQGRSR
ncbi:MAG TPA: 16S rRNA (cytosine(1402)-N(4))-methyltransferase RsmH [Thermomicrobiales bacterium]|jgi:16S rRNA (cytosine1402-N4)-methyltransferase|nr:16S rRNA (cytosine(1402)-N(4))-methyltransferase RsmH [Thermomicrobiales bacterium]